MSTVPDKACSVDPGGPFIAPIVTLVLALVIADAGLDGRRAAPQPAAPAPAPHARDGALSPRNASYSIDAELDPASRMLSHRLAQRHLEAHLRAAAAPPARRPEALQ